MDEKIPVKHIVIDEAQDFSVFQLYVLRKIIKDSSFTILGDLCQGIHAYRGIKNWQDVMTRVFDDRRTEYLTLEQSYRTTVEIMNAANRVVRRLPEGEHMQAKPVIRHGEPVKLVQTGSMKETAADICSRITEARSSGLKSVAVICRTLEECKGVQAQMKKTVPELYIITGKEDQYKGGIVTLPSYLSKGLEFDAVFITDAEEYGEEELDIKLLYVSMTRALHRLYIYYAGKPTPVLSDIGAPE
jgi:DNA helicase-2/ATP-dependent DNA helicase PcrA